MKLPEIFLVFALSISFQYAGAQASTAHKIYSAQVYKTSKTPAIDGYLYQLRDSSISLSSSPLLSSSTIMFHDIDVRDIRKINFQREGGAGKRTLIGALSGFALGSLLGYASGGDSEGVVSFSAGESALMLGTLFGIGGGIIYRFAGGKRSISINGNKDLYLQNNRYLKRYLLEK